MIKLIPKPAKFETRYGEFFINNDTKIYANEKATFAVKTFNELINKHCNFNVKTIDDETKASIKFIIDINLDEEEYIIDCTPDTLVVKHLTKAGAFYAVQSIRQLTKIDILNNADSLSMHSVYIKDLPANKWRGLMLDESRWFFGPTVVKELLDMMAMFKLNVFHWHLTDNVGWRIEIKKYPKLTKIGSYRRGTQNIAWRNLKAVDNTPHEGFYTQEEIKDIVAYAKERNIMIVPEIDFPAHFVAAIASYPELSCEGKQIEVSPVHFEFAKVIACAGKESTYEFMYDVIDELSELFDAPYFHIGGDEVPKAKWKKCPCCQEVIKRENLSGEEDLQGYVNNKLAVYLKRKNKKLIGWNEILKSKKLDSSIVVQYWTYHNDKRVLEHLESGGEAIISKHQAFYFDMTYLQNNLKTTYEYSHEKYGLKDCQGILGVECALWTEWIFSLERLQFQMYPRLFAFSEVAWTPEEEKDYMNFRKRVDDFIPTLEYMGKIYCPLELVDSCKLKAHPASMKFSLKNAHFEYDKAQKYRREKMSK